MESSPPLEHRCNVPTRTKQSPEISLTAAGPDPESFSAKVGDQVRWVNDGTRDTGVKFVPTDPAHPGSVAPPDSGPIEPGGDFGYTFTVPGEYQYTASGKKGKVVVSA